MNKAIVKDNVIMEREWREANPEEAKIDDALVRARVQQDAQRSVIPGMVDAAQSPVAQGRTTKCSDPNCSVRGTKLERKGWISCPMKGCKLIFCHGCDVPAANHIDVCFVRPPKRSVATATVYFLVVMHF